MMVGSLPRCGATRYCMDLAVELGLSFLGELRPRYLVGFNATNLKAQTHETGYAPTISTDRFIDALQNPDRYVSLINSGTTVMMPRVDRVILRKDVRAALLSQANYLLAYMGDRHASALHPLLTNTFEDAYGMLCYMERIEVPTIWYEDYFPDAVSKTPVLDASPIREILVGIVDRLLTQNNFLGRFAALGA